MKPRFCQLITKKPRPEKDAAYRFRIAVLYRGSTSICNLA